MTHRASLIAALLLAGCQVQAAATLPLPRRTEEEPDTVDRDRPVLINCPASEYPIDTGVRASSVEDFRNRVARCPECSEEHIWNGDEAWLAEEDAIFTSWS